MGGVWPTWAFTRGKNQVDGVILFNSVDVAFLCVIKGKGKGGFLIVMR